MMEHATLPVHSAAVDGKTAAVEYGISELDITLIRATNYTDDGYPIRTRIGVIRSNTLTQMGTLTKECAEYPFFHGLRFNVRLIDEVIQPVPVKEIIRRSTLPGVKSIVMLVGVQTNQFPRAQDIAAWFLPHNIPVLIGGFHVSGMLSMIGLTSDLREALSKGIILAAGEVENGRLPAILEDVVRGKAEPLYNFLAATPDLTRVPMPRLAREDFNGFASPYSTIDTGRGCPFTCDFCTIINVQGHTMRCRDPKQVADFARQCYRELGVSHSFFTDDNLARNPRWRELFTELIHLREEENIPFTFMMQADLAARKMPGGDFFILAARAGCDQVFLGVESVNRDNLRSQEKFQNQVGEYKGLIEHCHSLGITCHAGYIVGLPFDTPESLREDISELQRMEFDSASFYVLIPLPGSKDHQKWWKERKPMDKDFNTYDSIHATITPACMSSEQLMNTYWDIWEWFYSTEHMITILNIWKHDHASYWGKLFFFAAYLYASRIERLHPMTCGFWTQRTRADRRPGFRREAVLPFWWHQVKRTVSRSWGLVGLFFQLEEVWMRTRPKSKIEEALEELVRKEKQGIQDWRELKARELAVLYAKLRDQMPEVRIPSRIALWFKKRNPLAPSYTRSHVQRAWRKWYLHIWNPLKWIELWLFELVNAVRFLRCLLVLGR